MEKFLINKEDNKFIFTRRRSSQYYFIALLSDYRQWLKSNKITKINKKAIVNFPRYKDKS